MLTKRENLLEVIRGGKPDRYVNQFEYMGLLFDPILMNLLGNLVQGTTCKDGWGVTISYPEHVPGSFPVHSPELTVIKDAAEWKKALAVPARIEFTDEEWAPFLETANVVDRNETFATAFMGPGLFERLHFLMGMEEAMIAFYTEPEAMHELIEYLADWEIESAKQVISRLNPDALFHHDDWGSQISSFLSPEMFGEFLVPAYKRVYGFWKQNGIEVITHHSDSYAANLVPHMIDMGIDIWQGAISTNNLPELIKRYGGKISFQGGFDNGKIDRNDWTRECVRSYVESTCREYGTHYFIPSCTMGLPGSVYPGVFDAVTEEIDRMSKLMF